MSFVNDSITVSTILEVAIALVALVSSYVVMKTNINRLTTDYNKLQIYVEDGFDNIDTKQTSVNEKFLTKLENLDAKLIRDFKDLNKELEIKIEKINSSILLLDKKHSETSEKDVLTINKQLILTEDKYSKISEQLEKRIVSLGITVKEHLKDTYIVQKDISVIRDYEIKPLRKNIAKIEKILKSKSS